MVDNRSYLVKGVNVNKIDKFKPYTLCTHDKLQLNNCTLGDIIWKCNLFELTNFVLLFHHRFKKTNAIIKWFKQHQQPDHFKDR